MEPIIYLCLGMLSGVAVAFIISKRSNKNPPLQKEKAQPPYMEVLYEEEFPLSKHPTVPLSELAQEVEAKLKKAREERERKKFSLLATGEYTAVRIPTTDRMHLDEIRGSNGYY